MTKHSGVTIKLGLLLTGLLLTGVLMIVFLSAWKMRSILLEQESQIYQFILNDIILKAQEDLRVNIDLKKSDKTRQLIDSYFSQLEPVKRISIFDAQGTIIFDTNRNFVGTMVPKYWLQKSISEGQQLWSLDFQMLRGADAPIRNLSGEVVAYIVLLTEDIRAQGIGYKLVLSLSIVCLAVLALVLGLCMLLVWRIGLRIQTIVQPVISDLSELAYSPATIQAQQSDHAYAADALVFTQPVAAMLQGVCTAQHKLQQMVDAP